MSAICQLNGNIEAYKHLSYNSYNSYNSFNSFNSYNSYNSFEWETLRIFIFNLLLLWRKQLHTI